MPVVGTLTVDLVANTAQFSGDLGKASNDVKSFADDAGAAGGKVDYSMTEARHGVMLLGEEFGVHLPRGITTFIASIGPVGAALEAAFPFLAIAVGATLMIEHLVKMHDAAVELGKEWDKVGTIADSALHKTKDAILQAEIESDNLTGNKLDALHKKLTLIDHQSMEELVTEFDRVADELDKVLGKASRGAILTKLLGEDADSKVKTEFDSFKTQYQSLLNLGKDSEARGVLVNEILHAQEQLKKYQQMGRDTTDAPLAVNEQTEAYQKLISTLEQLNSLQDANTTLNQKKKGNVTTAADNSAAKDEYDTAMKVDSLIAKAHAELDKELEKQADDNSKIMENRLKAQVEAEVKAVDDSIKAGHEQLNFERGMANLQLQNASQNAKFLLATRQSSIYDQMQQERKAENDDYTSKVEAWQKDSALLAKYGMQDSEQQKKLDHQMELEAQQHENRMTKIVQSAEEERYKRIQQGEQKVASAFASSIAHSIMQNKSLAAGLRQIGEQMLEQAIQQSILMLLHKQTMQEKEQSMDAKRAASSVFASVNEHVPYPLNIVLAPLSAAAAFAGVMAFADGGTVPGSGSGDTVPAMLSPGETVVTKALTDQVKGSTTNNGGHHITYAPVIHAVDANGVESMLKRHADVFQKHVTATLRKAHKRG